MLETGLGRAANIALAALPGFTLPGDISGSSRFYVLKVLGDDEPVPEGEQEAYIVLTPPKPSR